MIKTAFINFENKVGALKQISNIFILTPLEMEFTKLF